MAKSQNPLFGYAWELSIDTSPDGDGTSETITVSSSSWDPEALRIVFDVDMPAFRSLWFAKVSIYNMNAATAQKVITQGMNLTLKAGFQTQPYGTIFEGVIYQPLWEREGVVDFKLTLMCYTGLAEIIGNFASVRGSAGSIQSGLIAQIAQASQTPVAIDQLSTALLPQSALPRPRPFFGDPNEFFERVAAGSNLQQWVGFRGLNMTDVQATAGSDTIEYSPTTGILGTPVQTQDGISMRVALDARLQTLNPAMQVKINNAVIRQLEKYPGDFPTILDKDGLYLVMGVRHVGDSRSDTWYTEITGCTSTGGKLAIIYDSLNPSQKLDRRSPQG